jgi:hypothetical protein
MTFKGKIYPFVLDLFFTKYYYGDNIKEDEVGDVCDTYGSDEKCIQNF